MTSWVILSPAALVVEADAVPGNVAQPARDLSDRPEV